MTLHAAAPRVRCHDAAAWVGCRALAAVVMIFWCAAARSAGGQVPAEVHGRITVRADGRPIAGARVEDRAGAGGSTTDDRGEFDLRGFAPGHHTLDVRAIGYRAASIAVTVENGRDTRADLALDAAPAHLAPVTVSAAASTGGETTITRAEIDRSARRDLGAVLADQPGVLVLPQGPPGAPSHLSIRGSASNEVLVLVDGVPINSPITGDADLSRIPVSAIQRITILRGAQSARWGPRALGGVVLIETRRPTAPEASLDVAAASWGARDATITLATTTALLTASRRQSRGDFPYDVPAVRGGGTATRGDGGASSSALDAAFGTALGPVTVRAHGTYGANARGLPGSVAAPSFTASAHDDRLAAGLDARDDAGAVRWTASLDADRDHTRFRDSTPPSGPPYDDRITANSVTVLAAATTGTPSHAASLGAESRLVDLTATDLAPNAPTAEHTTGIWAHGELTHDVPRLARLGLDATVRVDWSSLLSGPQLSPRAGISAVRGPLTLAVTVGNAFTPPSLADQFFHEGVLVRPNPNLRPERVRDELEGRITLRDIALGSLLHASGEIAAYRADVDGMILWFPDFRFVWSPENTNVRRGGWDASAELSMPATGVRLRGTLTDIAVDYATPAVSGQVAYRPRLAGSATLSVDRGPATVDVTARYIGDRRTVQGSPLNALGAYWLTNMQLTVRVLRAPWSLDVLGGVDDLLDRRVALLFDYPLPGRTWTLALRVRTPSHSGLP